jgi:hypothetical protein
MTVHLGRLPDIRLLYLLLAGVGLPIAYIQRAKAHPATDNTATRSAIRASPATAYKQPAT